MRPETACSNIFVRPENREIFAALSSEIPGQAGDLLLKVVGPKHSGRKTLLKELLKQRAELPGRHYLLSGELRWQGIREALNDPGARTLILCGLTGSTLNQHLTQLEFTAPPRPCLMAWDQEVDDENSLSAELYFNTEIQLFDEEDSRDLQRAMAKHFLGSVPEAEDFLSEKLESHDLYWYPCAFNAFRKALDLLSRKQRKVDFPSLFTYVDGVLD